MHQWHGRRRLFTKGRALLDRLPDTQSDHQTNRINTLFNYAGKG